MRASSRDPILLQIPPETSPVLQPTPGGHPHHGPAHSSHRAAHTPYADEDEEYDEDYEPEPNYRSSDLVDADNLEFIAPGQWDAAGESARRDLAGTYGDADGADYAYTYGSDDDDGDVPDFDIAAGDEDIDDWTLEDGHIEGLPCCNVRLDAK